MSKIVLTGNAGFIGSWIQDELIKQGHKVYGFDDLSGGFKRNINPKLSGMNVINLATDDLRQSKIIQDIKPDILYHVAASAHEGGSFFDPVKISKNNLMAYINILEECIKTGSLKFVCSFGSMAQYGEGKVPFKEDSPLGGQDPYAVNKTAMEYITSQLSKCYGFKYSWVVPHNVVGIRQSLDDPYRNLAGIMMNRIMRAESLYIYGDGEQKRQFSNIKDALPCFIKMMNPKFHGERVNIGSIEDITINELLKIIINNFKDHHKIPEIIHLPDRHGEVKNAYCSPDKSIKMLGYDEKYGIEKGIAEMSKWAMELGPKEWHKDQLAIYSNKWPKPWKDNYGKS